MITLEKIKPLTEPTSKRRQIYEALRQEIVGQRIPSGSPLPTTHALADRYAVAYNTVHFALNDLVREGCLVRHRGKGTFVAETAQQKKRPLSSDLVVVLPVEQDMVGYGTAGEVFQVLSGCAAGAAASGGRVGMVSLPSALKPADIPAALQQILPHDGAIFYGAQYTPLIQELMRQRFPVVTIIPEPNVASGVDYDRPAATQLGVTHLLEHGYRRIGYFGNISDRKYQYFCQTSEQRGIPVDPAFSQDCVYRRDAYEVALRFFAAPLPEAVFVDNPQKVQVLLQMAQSRGVRVPQDLAVMAYGADQIVAAELALSYVALPRESMGREAAVVLDQLVRGRLVPPVQRILPARLVIGQSCGCHPATNVAGGLVKEQVVN